MGKEAEFNGPYPKAFYEKDQLIWDPDTLLALRQFRELTQKEALNFFQMRDPNRRADADAEIMMDAGADIVETIRLGREVGLRKSFALVAAERGLQRAARGTVPSTTLHEITEKCVRPFYSSVGENLAA